MFEWTIEHISNEHILLVKSKGQMDVDSANAMVREIAKAAVEYQRFPSTFQIIMTVHPSMKNLGFPAGSGQRWSSPNSLKIRDLWKPFLPTVVITYGTLQTLMKQKPGSQVK